MNNKAENSQVTVQRNQDYAQTFSSIIELLNQNRTQSSQFQIKLYIEQLREKRSTLSYQKAFIQLLKMGTLSQESKSYFEEELTCLKKIFGGLMDNKYKDSSYEIVFQQYQKFQRLKPVQKSFFVQEIEFLKKMLNEKRENLNYEKTYAQLQKISGLQQNIQKLFIDEIKNLRYLFKLLIVKKFKQQSYFDIFTQLKIMSNLQKRQIVFFKDEIAKLKNLLGQKIENLNYGQAIRQLKNISKLQPEQLNFFQSEIEHLKGILKERVSSLSYEEVYQSLRQIANLKKQQKLFFQNGIIRYLQTKMDGQISNFNYDRMDIQVKKLSNLNQNERQVFGNAKKSLESKFRTYVNKLNKEQTLTYFESFQSLKDADKKSLSDFITILKNRCRHLQNQNKYEIDQLKTKNKNLQNELQRLKSKSQKLFFNKGQFVFSLFLNIIQLAAAICLGYRLSQTGQLEVGVKVGIGIGAVLTLLWIILTAYNIKQWCLYGYRLWKSWREKRNKSKEVNQLDSGQSLKTSKIFQGQENMKKMQQDELKFTLFFFIHLFL